MTSAHSPDEIALDANVLVIGGGMAAAWAAISAARAGAQVTLVDKGFVGTSGVTATGGPNHWWVPPDSTRRRAAVEERYARSFGLADCEWMARIIDTTWRTLPELAPYYPFGSDGRGGTYYSGLRGPEYLRALRRWALDLGVRILDHFPALELLLHADGSVAGAAGYARLARRPWQVRADATIVATGGCAFRSGLIGSHTNTGDGYLMAAEAGAELSGMEFSTAYSLSPAWNSTRTLPYPAARFFDAGGVELDIPPPTTGEPHLKALALAMIAGPVFADLGDAPELLQRILPRIQPASPTPFVRRGVRLFEDRFEVKLYGEGTIRGTGGLRIVGDHGETTVPALFAAGDAATRELVAGATSGGGAQNSAWALTSGVEAGKAAAALARRGGRRAEGAVARAGRAALRPAGAVRVVDRPAVVKAVQHEMLSYERAIWRRECSLRSGLQQLDECWYEIAAHEGEQGLGSVAARETAAMVATARWCTAAALTRAESRGLQMRADLPALRDDADRRLLTGGTDRTWTAFEPRAARPGLAA